MVQVGEKMNSNKVWEIIGKIALISTIIGCIFGIVSFLVTNKTNPYRVEAKYRIYDYYIDNNTINTMFKFIDLKNEKRINEFMQKNIEESDIKLNKKNIDEVSNMFYWYLQKNWDYSVDEERINTKTYGIYVIDIENKSDVALNNPFINTEMDNVQAFVENWDGSVERTSFKNTLKLNTIKAKDKVKIFLWKEYGAYPQDINLVFDKGTVSIDRYYEYSSKLKEKETNLIFYAWVIIQLIMLILFMSRKQKKET